VDWRSSLLSTNLLLAIADADYPDILVSFEDLTFQQEYTSPSDSETRLRITEFLDVILPAAALQQSRKRRLYEYVCVGEGGDISGTFFFFF
jgi:hypothetical protein